MVQIRIMHADPDRVRQVADLLLPLMRASGVLNVGDETELPNRRDGGVRIVVDVTPVTAVRVSAERADQPGGPRALPAASRPALPRLRRPRRGRGS